MELEKGQNVARMHEIFRKELKKKIAVACKFARKVSKIDPATDMYVELANDVKDTKRYVNSQKVLHLDFGYSRSSVYINNFHDFPMLIKLGLRQVLIANYGLTEHQLNSKSHQESYSGWYAQNFNRMVPHELGHYLGALNETSLEVKMGIDFYKSPDGEYFFYPFTDFKGVVKACDYKKFVVEGPENLSKGDKIIAGEI